MTKLERELETSLKEVLSVIFLDLDAPLTPTLQRALLVLNKAEGKRTGKSQEELSAERTEMMSTWLGKIP